MLNRIPWWIGICLPVMLLIVPDLLAPTLAEVWMQVPGLDKPAHFFAFVLVFLTMSWMLRGRAWPATESGKVYLAVILSLIIAVADEVQQAMVGRGRTAEYGDLVADAAGVAVGLTVMMSGRLGVMRTIAVVALLLVPVGLVTAKTYQDFKHFNRGMIYERQHDYQRAKEEYMLALKSGFASAELYNTIAWLDIEFLDKDPVEAERYAAQAFAMEPDNPDVLDTYGWVLVKSGRAIQGLTFLKRAELMKPEIYCIHLHLGVAYRDVGDANRARDYLNRQIRRNPTDRWGQSAKVALERMEQEAG